MKKDMLFVFILLTLCTVYNKSYNGRRMSDGKIYQHWRGKTVATWAYPLGTRLDVLYGTKEIEVRVTDRLSTKYKKDGRLDLSGYAMYYLTGSWKPITIKAKVKVIKGKKEGKENAIKFK